MDDRRPAPRLVRRLFGKLFADKAYLFRSLSAYLLQTCDLRLITKLSLT